MPPTVASRSRNGTSRASTGASRLSPATVARSDPSDQLDGGLDPVRATSEERAHQVVEHQPDQVSIGVGEPIDSDGQLAAGPDGHRERPDQGGQRLRFGRRCPAAGSARVRVSRSRLFAPTASSYSRGEDVAQVLTGLLQQPEVGRQRAVQLIEHGLSAVLGLRPDHLDHASDGEVLILGQCDVGQREQAQEQHDRRARQAPTAPAGRGRDSRPRQAGRRSRGSQRDSRRRRGSGRYHRGSRHSRVAATACSIAAAPTARKREVAGRAAVVHAASATTISELSRSTHANTAHRVRRRLAVESTSVRGAARSPPAGEGAGRARNMQIATAGRQAATANGELDLQ